jgi:hypothetical protein
MAATNIVNFFITAFSYRSHRDTLEGYNSSI